LIQKAASVVVKEFPKAATGYIKWFLRAAGVVNILRILEILLFFISSFQENWQELVSIFIATV
jgi:hypothetical protein